ncbi:hypothetical protein A2851_04345 [Candidatus Kaiserbacteria bacterium RIFCSPHIGHO2_01_FULL_53_29]|uniref:General secretion pathway GspH domain-containing protein n=2 Tax=Candidatus Kaiseribacteriota TaxID=1752734 RepID=A0A1F6CUP7_9BACT|nr:MAG: hypothetical protein A2851_04345 [Candidatus Kaiserbacteria bacterium RIFCSPHIGHO2_01_FULL_53_29]
MIVMALVTIVGAFGLLLGTDSYRGYSFHSDHDILVAALQHARSQAIGNVCLGEGCTHGMPHGVFIDAAHNRYVIFQGTNYATRDGEVDAALEAAPGMTRSGLSEIVFAQLSGSANSAEAPPWGIVLTDPTGRTSTTTIESEGRIWWTH